VIHVAVEPKTKNDQDNCPSPPVAVRRRSDVHVRSDEETGQTVIGGMGELHLEVLVDRMLREFRWTPTWASLRWPTRDVKAKVEKVEERYVRQTVAVASTATSC